MYGVEFVNSILAGKLAPLPKLTVFTIVPVAHSFIELIVNKLYLPPLSELLTKSKLLISNNLIPLPEPNTVSIATL